MRDVNLLALVGAAMAGLLVGLLLSGDRGRTERALAPRIEALEARLTPLEDAPAALAALTAATGDLAGRIGALQERPAAAPPLDASGTAGPSWARAVPPGGLALSVGQTAPVGSARVFLARVAANAAHVVVIGVGATRLEAGAPPLALADECALALEAVVEGKAYFLSACGAADR